MARLSLRVDKNVYQDTIGTLTSYVGELQVKLGQYRTMRTRIDDIWDDSEATKYKTAVDEMVTKVQATIDATNAEIEVLRDLLSKKEEEELHVDKVVQDALDIVHSLF